MKIYEAKFELCAGCSVSKRFVAENTNEAYNMMKDYIKQSFPSRADEVTKTTVKLSKIEED